MLPDTFLVWRVAGLRHHMLGLSHSLYFPPEVNWHVFERDVLCLSKGEYLCLGTDYPKSVGQTFEIVIMRRYSLLHSQIRKSAYTTVIGRGDVDSC